jgi:hypothetical protein
LSATCDDGDGILVVRHRLRPIRPSRR